MSVQDATRAGSIVIDVLPAVGEAARSSTDDSPTGKP